VDDRPDLASLVAAAQAAAVEWDVSLGAPFALSR
jgi:hypothetical protein